MSPVLRRFRSPILYQDIVLNNKEKVGTFIRIGERFNSLQHTKSLGLTYYGFEAKAHLCKPRRILDTISRNASPEALRLCRVQFRAEPITASLFSQLSGVTVLIPRECHFGGFEDLVSFISCFPRCEIWRLRGRDRIKLKFRGLPIYDLASRITDTDMGWGDVYRNQEKVVGTGWLNLTGLKSFAYVMASAPISECIAACELLGEIDLTLLCW